MFVEPEPDMAPPVQVSTDVAVSAPVPVIVPPDNVAVTTEARVLEKLAVPALTRSVCAERGPLPRRLAVPPVTWIAFEGARVPLMLVVPTLKESTPLEAREDAASRLCVPPAKLSAAGDDTLNVP